MTELGLEPRFPQLLFNIFATMSYYLPLLPIYSLESRYLGVKCHLLSILQIFQA